MLKNKTKRILCLLLTACMVLSVLAGCSNSSNDDTEGDITAAVSQAPETSTPEETQEETQEAQVQVPEALVPDADGNVTFTDMAGRTITVPENPVVWNSSPTSEGWLCAIAPDQIVGWAAEFTEEQLSYFPASVADLEVLGGNFGSNEANVEGILAASPDAIINTYDVSEGALEATIASADQMAEQYGIPVIVISRDIADTAKVAGLIGQWLGQPERGAEVEAYLQTVLDEIQATVNAVPEENVVNYYYAEGTDGLSTEAEDSFHADVYSFCGLTPACGNDVSQTNMGGMEAVSLEQVLQWDPEYIFVWNGQAYQDIISSDSWADITAVKNGNVYLNPSLPQNWVDRSPNSLRILGCLFTAAKCYPDYCTYDLDEEVKGFFQFMYDVELTDEQLAALY